MPSPCSVDIVARLDTSRVAPVRAALLAARDEARRGLDAGLGERADAVLREVARHLDRAGLGVIEAVRLESGALTARFSSNSPTGNDPPRPQPAPPEAS